MLRLLLLLSLVFGPSFAQAVIYPRLLTASHSRLRPYVLVGQLLFTSGDTEYVGSGSVIRPKSVLTAGHNVYDGDTGWSTGIKFYRGKYGAEVLNVQAPNHIYLLGGYQQNAQLYGPDDVRSFAYDAAGLTFNNYLAGGGYLAFTSNLLTLGNGRFKMGVGYAAEGNHDGDFPFVSMPPYGFSRTQVGFFETPATYFEGGMSGGPILVPGPNGTFQVAGLIVSSSSQPFYGGIRVVDVPLATLIRTHLF